MTNKTPLLIIGASGHGKVILDCALSTGLYDIIGFLDGSSSLQNTTINSFSVLGTEYDCLDYCQKINNLKVIVAIGDNFIRQKVSEAICLKYLEKFSQHFSNIEEVYKNLFPLIIDPSAVISSFSKIAEGTVIMQGCVVNSNAEIGKGCILNTLSSLGHDSTLNDYASLAPAVAIGGSVVIGKRTAISIGATVKHGINIGKDTVIGAGAVVLKNVDSNIVAYGVPSKFIRSRNAEDSYL